jgi:hypothetical protein
MANLLTMVAYPCILSLLLIHTAVASSLIHLARPVIVTAVSFLLFKQLTVTGDL